MGEIGVDAMVFKMGHGLLWYDKRQTETVICKKEARAIDKGVLTASQLATQPTNQPSGVPASPPVVKLGQPVTDRSQSVSKVEPAG